MIDGNRLLQIFLKQFVIRADDTAIRFGGATCWESVAVNFIADDKNLTCSRPLNYILKMIAARKFRKL